MTQLEPPLVPRPSKAFNYQRARRLHLALKRNNARRQQHHHEIAGREALAKEAGENAASFQRQIEAITASLSEAR